MPKGWNITPPCSMLQASGVYSNPKHRLHTVTGAQAGILCPGYKGNRHLYHVIQSLKSAPRAVCRPGLLLKPVWPEHVIHLRLVQARDRWLGIACLLEASSVGGLVSSDSVWRWARHSRLKKLSTQGLSYGADRLADSERIFA